MQVLWRRCWLHVVVPLHLITFGNLKMVFWLQGVLVLRMVNQEITKRAVFINTSLRCPDATLPACCLILIWLYNLKMLQL